MRERVRKPKVRGVWVVTHIDSDQKEIAKKEEEDSVRWADPAGSHSSR